MRWILLIAGVLLQGAALYCLFFTDAKMWAPLFLHVAGASLAAEGSRMQLTRGREKKEESAFWGSLLVGLAPFIGALGLVFFARKEFPLEASMPDESLESLRSRAARTAQEKKRGQQEIGRGVESVVDALADRDPQVRIRAIESLSGKQSPEVVRILKMGRENSLFDVRVRSIEQLNKMSQAFRDELTSLATRISDGDKRNIEEARILLNYEKLGIEDAQASFLLLQRAEKCLANITGAGSTESYLLRAKTALALKKPTEAEKLFTAVLQVKFEESAFEGLAESQFLQRKFSALAKTAAWGESVGQALAPELTQALSLWGGEARG